MYHHSPFIAMGDNPISYNDPDGDVINLAAAGIGAVAGGFINLGIQAFKGNITTLGDAGAAFGIGAFAGGVTGLTMGATAGLFGTATLGGSIASGVVSGGAGGAVGGLIQETGNAIYFQDMNFGDAVRGPGLSGAIWGGAIGGVFGGVSGYFSYSPSVSSGPPNKPIGPGDDIVSIQIDGKTIEVPGVMHKFPDILDDAGNTLYQVGKYIDKFTGMVTNKGPMLPGGYGVPKFYTYGNKVHVHPHSFKHLQELGKNRPLEYRRLIGEQFQESMHSSIDDVMSRSGSLKYNYPYNSGGNRIIFGKPGKSGILPVVKHFSRYK